MAPCFSEEVNDFDGIASLARKRWLRSQLAPISFAGSFAELQQSARIVNDEVGVHSRARADAHRVPAGVFWRRLSSRGRRVLSTCQSCNLGVIRAAKAVSDPVGFASRWAYRRDKPGEKTDDDF